MRKHTFQIVLLLATLSILGIVSTQIYWTLKAWELNSARFDRQVDGALLSVVGDLLNNARPDDSRMINPVQKVRADYWVVMVNDVIDANLLEHLLRKSFHQRQIDVDFEYAIYDCESRQLRYGDLVHLNARSSAADERKVTVRWPKWDQSAHYFGVFFPARTSVVWAGMQSWALSSVGILFVVCFFVYTVFTLSRQRRFGEIQTDFINTMAHEFKTPISTISLSNEALKHVAVQSDPTKIERYTNIIKSEVERLSGQIDKILDVARTDSDTFHLEKSLFNLTDLINQITLQFQIPIGKHPTNINGIAPDDLFLYADKLHITNVLYNLLDNAVKYGQPGNTINIRAMDKGKKLVIQVTDAGPGISDKHLKNVFRKFYRVPTGNLYTKERGFGLGLTYVKNIVEAHNGRISIESEPGNGTTISVTLPNKKISTGSIN